jgi:hypothetical protein
VSFARQLLRTPTTCDSLETFALSDANAINHFVLLENSRDLDLLLKVLASPVNLLSNGSAIDLDLHDVSLLVAMLQDLDLKKSRIS